MRDFEGKVAVITGAANGMGQGLAERCAQEGMRVVSSDIDEHTLIKAEEDLKIAEADVMAVLTAVSKAGDVEALARKTLDAFGAVHLLCNNGGMVSVDEFIEPI